WSSTQSKTTATVVADAPLGHTTTRIELSRAALSGRAPEPRWFLPQDACDVRTASGRMKMDPHGTSHPDPPSDAREIWFRRSSTATCTTLLPAPDAPNWNDVDVGPKVRGLLTPIALEWTAGATT